MKNVSTATDPAAPRHRLTILDEDPLRARREARELFDALTETYAEASLDQSPPRTEDGKLKGVPVSDLIGLVLSDGYSGTSR
ncbi:hypothetical protein ACFYNV_19930 [Streptomyces albidoflavus]|uniref:hypothetical protein n=1 Tax=Streptomyces albidoflavus TaxID=1886 RepID=UPI0033DC3604